MFSKPVPTNFRSALPWIMLVSLMFVINYTDRSIFSPLLVYMEQEFNLDHAQATRLLFFMSCGFCSSMALSGFVLAYVKPRLVVGCSTVGCGVMLFFISGLQSIELAWLVFILHGFMGGLYFTAAMSTLSELSSAENWGKTIALHELAPPISFILAPIIAHKIIMEHNWRSVLIVLSICSISAGLFFILAGKGGENKTARPSWSGISKMIKSPLLWLFTWLFALGVAGEFATYSILPLHLTTERGFSPQEAERLLAFSRLGAPAAVLLGGLLINRFKAAGIIKGFLIIHGISLLCMALPYAGVSLAGMFIQPMATACVFPAIFMLFAQGIELELQPVLLSLSIPLSSYIGSGIIPAALGILGKSLSFSCGFALMGLLCLATLPLLRILRKGR